MKLLVFCLFAACCCCLANTGDKRMQRRKLEEVRRQLTGVMKAVMKDLQEREKTLNTPPENIEDCCCLSALKCFQTKFQETFNTRDRTKYNLNRSLKNSLTQKGLDFCDSKNSTCHECDSHPKNTSREFFNRLDSLIQKAISKL